MLQLALSLSALAALTHAWVQSRHRAVALGLGFLLLLLAGGSLLASPVGQKVAGQLIMPSGLVWLVITALGFVALWRGESFWAIALFGLWLAYTAAGSRLTGTLLMRSLEAGQTVIPVERRERVDAAFVLGGGVGVVEFDVIQLGTHGDRAVLAARMYHLGKAPFLVSSGMSLPGTSRVDLSDITAKLWRQLGVPASAIIRIPKGYNTKTELEAYGDLIHEHGWTRVGVITSAFHMPRVMRHAKRLGLSLIPIPADHRGRELGPWAMALVPSREGFARVGRASWEWIGMWVGR